MRTPAVEPARVSKQTPPVKYGPAQWARPSFTEGFPGSALPHNRMGRFPADRPLNPQERRPERDGSLSLRVLYAAHIGHCRSCLLRTRCQESSATIKPSRNDFFFPPLLTSTHKAGVQRAVAFAGGSGVSPENPFFLSSPPQAASYGWMSEK
jgi:hypothetical protein